MVEQKSSFATTILFGKILIKTFYQVQDIFKEFFLWVYDPVF